MHFVNIFSKLKKYKSNIGFILLIVVGLSIVLYPTISNWWNQRFASQMVNEYDRLTESKDIDFKTEITKARQYNKNLSPKSVPDAFSAKEHKRDIEYEKCLNIANNSMMGYVKIPNIDVELPIFHYTDEETLKKGVGHLCGSSLPIGEKGTHAILSAHRGLPSAKLFTDLNLLRKKDKFYLHILNKKMAYEVDSIKIVKPNQTSSLQAVKNEDYVTLMTCTPYGVNSHRLLVRGHRVPYKENSAIESRKNMNHLVKIVLCIIIGCVVALVVAKILEKRKYIDKKFVFRKWRRK